MNPSIKKSRYMENRRPIIFVVLMTLLLSILSICVVNAKTDMTYSNEKTVKSIVFQNAMRKLWEDHVFYTRLVIISVDGDKRDLGPTVDRLLQNQVEIGDAIKPYYGEAAGNQLTALLQDHIKTAGDLLMAAKAGDAAKATDAKSKWYANGDDIAMFLSGANPKNWRPSATKQMMMMHLDTTIDEATARFKGDWKADIAAFDKANQHILKMADTLSMGIIHQFPDKFVDKTVLVPTENYDEMDEGY